MPDRRRTFVVNRIGFGRDIAEQHTVMSRLVKREHDNNRFNALCASVQVEPPLAWANRQRAIPL
jgi:hypothetical protein